MNKKTIKNAENIVLFVNGGIGRNITATAVVRNIKKAYPDKDLVVVAGCPDIFLRNPNIKRVLRMGQCFYFYEDYILNSKSYVINIEPYQSYDYFYKNKHFVECWLDMIGIPCDNVYPELFFSENENRMAELFLEKFDKPMVLIQHSGGMNPKDKSEKEQLTSKSSMYRRNIPKETIQKVADVLIAKGYMIGSVQSENQFCISMAEKIQFPVRAIMALIPHVAGVIAIDSFLQHGCAALKKKAVVLWGGTSPKVLGYDSNINLTRSVCDNPFCHRPNSYLFDVEPTGFMWDCKHNDSCMNFPAEDIISAITKELGKQNGEQNTGRIRKNTEISDAKQENRTNEASIRTGKEIPTGDRSTCPVRRDRNETCPGDCNK